MRFAKEFVYLVDRYCPLLVQGFVLQKRGRKTLRIGRRERWIYICSKGSLGFILIHNLGDLSLTILIFSVFVSNWVKVVDPSSFDDILAPLNLSG